jgi:hypothetical protein
MTTPPRTPPVHARAWTPLARVAFRFAFCYFLLFILCCANVTVWEAVPLGGTRLEHLAAAPVFALAAWVGGHWLHLSGAAVQLHHTGFGDRTLDWLAAGVLVCIALLIAAVWSACARRREYATLYTWFRYALRLAVIASMFIYGGMKIVPIQIPAPSLAVLNQTVGSLSPMTLLWALLGLNPRYEMICGALEMLAGVLLLFRRTALAGTLTALVIMANVLLFDLFFDVPVKLYSAHLIVILLLLLAPDARALVRFLFLGKMSAPISEWSPRFPREWMRVSAFTFEALLVLMIGVHWPYARLMQYRQQQAMRAHPSPWVGIWHVDDSSAPLRLGFGQRVTDIVFEPDGQLSVRAEDGTLWGGADYHRDDKTIAVLLPPGPAAMMQVTAFDGAHMTLTSAAPGNAMTLHLTRVPLPEHYNLHEHRYQWTNDWGAEM